MSTTFTIQPDRTNAMTVERSGKNFEESSVFAYWIEEVAYAKLI